VVSAVGHEIDFTISDLVSDIRAPPPSAAGELIVPDSDRLLSNLRMMEMKMRREVELILERLTRRFQYLASSHGLKRVPGMIEEMIQRLDRQHLTMKRDLAELLHGMEQGLADLAGRLDILSPLATLARGYSITYRLPGGGLVRKAAVLSMGDRVGIRFEVGKAECEVLEVEER
jgi:exodeoxyribonuclease VII large subunit